MLHAPGDLVLVAQRLGGGGLGGGVGEERLAHLVDRRAELLGAAQGEAHPQPAQAVDLGERAQEDEVRVVAQEVDGGVGVVQRGELAVGLVHDHAHVGRDALHQFRQRGRRHGGAGRVVGVADDQQAGGHRHRLGQRVEVVAVVGVEVDGEGGGAGGRRQVGVHRERRPGVDQLGAGLEQRLPGRQQHVAGAVADRDPVRRHARE